MSAMQAGLLFVLWCNAAWGAFLPWSGDSTGVFDYKSTGRMFVTMLGYPSKCEKKGVSHSCTLSLACWLVGGSSQAGCGGSSWLVACCVVPKAKKAKFTRLKNEEDGVILPEMVATAPVLQKRIDDGEDECGISGDRILSKRIIGGSEAKFGQFPWQAFIKIAAFQCGGVLVSRNFVATAAHCILTARPADTLVYLGELDTQDTGLAPEALPAQLHRVRRALVHPRFALRATQPDRFDLALLQLATAAAYAPHVAPICLPPAALDLRGREGVVAGWGKAQRSAAPLGTHVLRAAAVPLVGIGECARWHRLRQIAVELHEEMLCAGLAVGRRDACLGDSGGPLIVLEAGRWTLVGIISAGFGCGEPHQPGIYHRVAASVGWIREVIEG